MVILWYALSCAQSFSPTSSPKLNFVNDSERFLGYFVQKSNSSHVYTKQRHLEISCLPRSIDCHLFKLSCHCLLVEDKYYSNRAMMFVL